MPMGDAAIQHPGLVGERPVQSMDRGTTAHRADTGSHRPGVVMQDVELVAALIGRHGMGGLIPGVADQLLRRHLPQRRDQPGVGLRSWGANRVTLWPRSVSPSASNATTHSMPPYPLGGTGYQGGAITAIRTGDFLACEGVTEPGYPPGDKSSN